MGLAGHVGVMHVGPVRPLLGLVVHTGPHVGQAHTGGPEAWVLVLRGALGDGVSVGQGVHGVPLWPLAGRVHAGLGGGPGLKGHRARA